jgi:hypothetical protein
MCNNRQQEQHRHFAAHGAKPQLQGIYGVDDPDRGHFGIMSRDPRKAMANARRIEQSQCTC